MFTLLSSLHTATIDVLTRLLYKNPTQEKKMHILWHVIEGPSQADSNCCFRFITHYFPYAWATEILLCSHPLSHAVPFATGYPHQKILQTLINPTRAQVK